MSEGTRATRAPATAPPTAAPSAKRSFVRTLAQLGLGGAILIAVLRFVPVQQVATALAQTSVPWLLAGLGISVLISVLAGAQMRRLLECAGARFELREVLAVNLVTQFYGLFLPSYLAGGAIRWYHFSSEARHGAQALAAMVANRLLEILTLLLVGTAFFALARAKRVESLDAAPWLAVALLGVVALTWTALSARVHAAGMRLAARAGVPGRWQGRLGRLAGSLAVYRALAPRVRLGFLLQCALRQVMGVAGFVCFARAVSIEVHPFDLGWVRSALDLVLLLPVSIGGIGVREASLVALLEPLGVTPAAAVALAVLLLARSILTALGGGVIELARVRAGRPAGFSRRA